METRLNHPDHLTKNSVTETILTLEPSVWKPGLIIQITSRQKNSYDRDNLYVRAKCMETRLNHPDHLTKIQ